MATGELVSREAVAEAFGLDPGPWRPMAGGSVNQHWRVARAGREMVLRRYAAGQSAEGVAWEAGILRHARDLGWIVAAPERTHAGTHQVTIDGSTFALFPLPPGEPLEGAEARASLGRKGELLATLHADLAHAPFTQRPDLGRAWELDALATRAGGLTFNSLLARFTQEFPEVGRAIRAARYRNLRELARLGYGDLPDLVTHCDFHTPNILFVDGEVSGLLDFDWAHRDAAAYDIAVSLSLDCLAPPVFDAVSPEAAGDFVRGYGKKRRLAGHEVVLIPALVRAAWLWLATFRLVQWHNGWLPAERAAASLARTAERRLPALDAGTPALLAALRRALE